VVRSFDEMRSRMEKEFEEQFEEFESSVPKDFDREYQNRKAQTCENIAYLSIDIR
jgi:hypothetical protein